jgi:integrase
MISNQENGGDTGPKAVFRKVAECLYRHESSGTYYGLVKRGGKQFRRSLKTDDRQLASRRLADLRAKVGKLTNVTSARRITFAELADRWFGTVRGGLKPSSARRIETCIAQLKPFFANTSIRNISRATCDDWVTKRGDEISASTFNKEFQTLRLILKYACRDGLLLDNPASHIEPRKQSKAELVIPTRGQFRSLVEKVRSMDARAKDGAVLIELLAYSGMRLGEATSLRWRNVDLERGAFVVTGGEVGTKNNEARTVPLFPSMRSFLERLKTEQNPQPNDFVSKVGTAKKALASACKKAELPKFTHHALRHYFVSNAIEAGIDFKVIASWVGHKDGGVLVAKTYGHLRDTHSFEMAKRMTFDATNT